MTKKLTIRDIASEAGVSAATVSLVLNGKGEITSETRSRVLEAVARLDYTPRVSRPAADDAETLRFLKIAKHGHTVNRDHSIFISDYIDGMSAEASKRRYKLEVVSFEGVPISQVAETLAGAPVSGVIALGTELSEPDIRLLQASGLPTVFIDTYFEVLDANFVDMNNEDAVFKVLSRFKQSGFERIGFIASYVETTNFKLRGDAFFKNMSRLALKVVDKDILSIESTYEGAHGDMVELLRSGIHLAPCYFCTNDVIAYGVIRALKEFDIRVPEDVAIIGFDNLPQSATMEPALTTIEVSKRKIGNLAVSVLDDIVKSQEQQPPVKVLVGADLIARASDLVVGRSTSARTPVKKAAQIG